MKKLLNVCLNLLMSMILFSCESPTGSASSNTNTDNTTGTIDSTVTIGNNSWLLIYESEEEYLYTFNYEVVESEDISKAISKDTIEYSKDSIDLMSKKWFETGYYPNDGGWYNNDEPLTDESFYLVKLLEGSSVDNGEILEYDSKFNSWILDKIAYDYSDGVYQVSSDTLYWSQNFLETSISNSDTLVEVISRSTISYNFLISGDTLTLKQDFINVSEDNSKVLITELNSMKFIRWKGNPPSLN